MTKDSQIKLGMSFHPESRCYSVHNIHDHFVKFPSKEQVQKTWGKVFPKVKFRIDTCIKRPTIGFYVKIGGGTKTEDRQRFCKLLATLCTVVE